MTAQSYASRYPNARSAPLVHLMRKDQTTEQLRREVEATRERAFNALVASIFAEAMRECAPDFDAEIRGFQ